MSQFDFPRLHFSGSAFINPATANNNILLPLVTFDPIQVKAVLPPRIYLSPDLLYLAKLGGLPLPESGAVLAEDHGQAYLEIKSIDTPERFRSWATTPLGTCPLDATYHALYPLVKIKRTGKPLSGHLPANWNFYGGMEFGFKNVTIKSGAIVGPEMLQQIFEAETPGCPADLAAWLGAELALENDNGRSTAVMIDLLPSMAFFSQVFCDSLRLKKKSTCLMNGKPTKGSLRFLNLHRIVNQDGAMGASGSFFSTIAVQDVVGGETAPIFKLFRKYSTSRKLIQGIFIRYDLFEVLENLNPDYQSLGTASNPAYATVTGSLTPWYAGEMVSIGMGRQLIPEQAFMEDISLAPFICRIDPGRKVISLDLQGSIPELRTEEIPEATYETYPMGLVKLKLLEEGQPPLEVGEFTLDAAHLGRDLLLRTGGMVEFSWRERKDLTLHRLQAGTLALFGVYEPAKNQTGTEVVLMREAEYLVASDQAGMYADQGQNPEAGYLSFGPGREFCHIRVFKKGKPYLGKLPMTIMELKITPTGAAAAVNLFLHTESFRDGQTLVLPTDQAANAMYVFYPGAPAKISTNLIPYLIQTGFFISLRVLPRRDYGKYLDPNHPHYPTPILFEVLYQELLEVYDLMYPVSSMITPFTEPYFQKGKRFIQFKMAPEQWSSSSYMPSSRDMSRDQWALFCKWAEGF